MINYDKLTYWKTMKICVHIDMRNIVVKEACVSDSISVWTCIVYKTLSTRLRFGQFGDMPGEAKVPSWQLWA